MDWFLYYDLAQQWAGQGGEAHERAAVSRAYYAMFCTARNELKENMDGYNPPKCGSEHKYVWDSYKQNLHPRAPREIGTLGNRLRRARNRVDYCDVITDLPDVVENAMDDAHELKGHLEDLWY